MAPCANLINLWNDWDEIERRNFSVSIASGVLFFLGWWIVIDAAAVYPANKDLVHAYHAVGVVATLAMFMLNVVNTDHLESDGMTDGCLGGMGIKIWFVLGLLLSFGSIIGASWILFGGYVVQKYSPVWPGIAVFLQNLLIFLSSLLYKFGRGRED